MISRNQFGCIFIALGFHMATPIDYKEMIKSSSSIHLFASRGILWQVRLVLYCEAYGGKVTIECLQWRWTHEMFDPLLDSMFLFEISHEGFL